MDLAALTDADLEVLRIDLLAERARRARIAQAPEQIAAATRDALAVGVTVEAIRAAVEVGLVPTGSSPEATT